MPTDLPRSVHAAGTSWTPSSRALGHIALRCFTAFSMTPIEGSRGTLYLFSSNGRPGYPLLIPGYKTARCEYNPYATRTKPMGLWPSRALPNLINAEERILRGGFSLLNNTAQTSNI